jgi:CheY-like chemotaxis protein
MLQTILVVEDEAANLRLISYFLHQQGYQVLEAQDGLEAAELLNEIRVDMILSDLRMPRMDGIALARHVRSKVPDTPMLVITAYAEEDIEVLSELQVPVMRKPFIPDQLNRQIQNVLSSREITS